MIDFENLNKKQARLKDALDAAARAQDARDAEVARLNAAGVTKYRLAQIVGISQQAIAKIVKNQNIDAAVQNIIDGRD